MKRSHITWSIWKLPSPSLDYQLYNISFQELVSIPTKSRDWKGIFISLLVIMMVVGMVALTIKVVTPPIGPPR